MTVRVLPTPVTERYVGRRELAGLLGISLRQLDRFRSEGMPEERWGMRKPMFRPSLCLQWVRERGLNQ